MTNHWEAKGKNFLITGGASGLGAAYAEVFLKRGAKRPPGIERHDHKVTITAFRTGNYCQSERVVIILLRVKITENVIRTNPKGKIAILDVAEEVGEATAARLNESFPQQVLFVKCDVSDESNIQKAFDEVIDKFGQIDVLINNAGLMNDSPAVYRTACDVNWKGLVSFTFKAIDHMNKEEGGVGGTIINISSTVALTKFPFLPAYSGSKIAVLHFSQCLAMEPFYETKGIRVLTICFGPTDTPLLQGLENRTYMKKLGQSFQQSVVHLNVPFQKVESAIKAFVEMFETGSPGSIWLSCKDQPVKDITSAIDSSFITLEKLLSEN